MPIATKIKSSIEWPLLMIASPRGPARASTLRYLNRDYRSNLYKTIHKKASNVINSARALTKSHAIRISLMAYVLRKRADEYEPKRCDARDIRTQSR
jgi:hypothetical protein